MGETAYYNINSSDLKTYADSLVNTLSSSCDSSTTSASVSGFSTIPLNHINSNTSTSATISSSSGTSASSYVYNNSNTTTYSSNINWNGGNGYSTAGYASWYDVDSYLRPESFDDAMSKCIKDKLKEIISTEDDMMPLIKRYLRDYLEEILENPGTVFDDSLELKETKDKLQQVEEELEETKSQLRQAQLEISNLTGKLYTLENDLRRLKPTEEGGYTLSPWSTSSPFVQWDYYDDNSIVLKATNGRELGTVDSTLFTTSNHPPEIG